MKTTLIILSVALFAVFANGDDSGTHTYVNGRGKALKIRGYSQQTKDNQLSFGTAEAGDGEAYVNTGAGSYVESRKQKQEAPEAKASEPEASEPQASEPQASESEASEPKASESEASEPETSEPQASQPEAAAEAQTEERK